MANSIYSDGFDFFEGEDGVSLWPQLQQPPPIFPTPLTPPATQQAAAHASQLQLPSLASLRGFNSTYSGQQANNTYNTSIPDFGDTQSRYQPFLPPVSPLPQHRLDRIGAPSLPSFPDSINNRTGTSHTSHLNTNLPSSSYNIPSLLDLSGYPGPLSNPTRTDTPNWSFGSFGAPQQREPHSDDYLQALVNGDFSSPSIPPLSPRIPQHSILESANAPRPAQPPEQGLELFPGANTTGSFWPIAPQSQGVFDPTKDERESKHTQQPLLSNTQDNTMPPTTRRKRNQASVSSEPDAPVTKRRRTTLAGPSTHARPKISPKRLKQDHDEAPFKEENIFDSDNEQEKLDVVNLVDLDEDVVVEQKAKADNTVKLGNFQCVICMDDVKDLTVTFCGHLFCGECLHSSLHIDATKKICPICRQKIDTRSPGPRSKPTTRSYFPLELKRISRNRMGKRPAFS